MHFARRRRVARGCCKLIRGREIFEPLTDADRRIPGRVQQLTHVAQHSQLHTPNCNANVELTGRRGLQGELRIERLSPSTTACSVLRCDMPET